MVMCAYLLPVNLLQNFQRHINYTACYKQVRFKKIYDEI